MQKNLGLCLYNISPLLETTGRTNKKFDKTYQIGSSPRVIIELGTET